MLYRRFTIISLMMLGTALLAGSLLNEVYREKRSLTPFISATLSHNEAHAIDRNTAMPLSGHVWGG